MKSFVIAIALCSALAFVRAAPATSDDEKENKAVKECNATIHVQKNPRLIIAEGIAAAKPINLSQVEKCFLHCFLQKVGFLDDKANIKNGKELIQYTLKKAPEIAKYSDVIIASIFQISRSTKGIEDKCQKAFVTYHQFATDVFTLGIAEGLDTTTGIKDKIVNSIQSGQPIDKEIESDVKLFLGFFDMMVTSFAEDSAKAQGKAKTA